MESIRSLQNFLQMEINILLYLMLTQKYTLFQKVIIQLK